MKSRAVLAGLILASLLATPAAQAQSSRSQNARYCAELEGELARLQRSGNTRSNRNFEKYDAAVHKQQAQIDSANQRAKRDSCFGGRGFLFKRTPKATCPALLKRIDKMERNLVALQKKRGRYPAPSGNSNQLKANILDQLAQARCGEQYERFAQPAPTRRQGLFAKLFQPRSTVREYNQQYDIPEIGTYRTVCVRACDGFFFPVSFSTTESNFARDDSVCQASCPGTSAELYVYQNPGQSEEEMVSLGGRPYQSLETAFLYKKQYVPNCSCQAPISQLTALTTSDQPLSTPRTEQVMPVNNSPIVPLPLPKQTVMVDPDTLAVERLGMTFKPYRPPEVSSDKGLVHTADGRSIRIVGPKFFGNQE
ncbi:DUF2865 domain-containing protein [Cohaesibacter celericrescens]|nr:DUF2865 domain-containing protein [Cohaesibacter celericrescens]